MQAIFLKQTGDPFHAFESREVKTPDPQAGEIRIKTEFSGLNFADVLARQGLYKNAPPLPFVPGYEVVGTVDAVGPSVKSFKEGDRVVSGTPFGGYASHVITDPGLATILPKSIDGAAGTAIPTQYGTAWYCAEVAVRLFSGDRVLIHAAAGGVGIALIQMAKQKGCEIFGTVGSEEKVEYLRKIGVDHPVNYRAGDFDKTIKKILGKGARLDVVFDSLGGNTFRKSYGLLGSGGRIVSYGIAEMASEKKNIAKTMIAAASFGMYHPLALLAKSKAIIGVNMFNITQRKKALCTQMLRELVQQVADGKLSPVVSRVFPHQEIGKAHEWLGNRGSIGKVAISWT